MKTSLFNRSGQALQKPLIKVSSAFLISFLWHIVVLAPSSSFAQQEGLPLNSSEDAQLNNSSEPTVFSEDFNENYLLGPGDRLLLEVYAPRPSSPTNVPEYDRDIVVSADGTLNLPLIGSVNVRGKTINQVSDELFARYSEYIRNPILNFFIVQPRPLQIAVVGEVSKPGSYIINVDPQSDRVGENGSAVPTLTQAIQLAGGITESADIRNIKISRAGQSAPNSRQIVNANLWSLLESGDLGQDFPLRDGDSIMIPEAVDITDSEALALGAVSFSPESINVYVVGEVGTPGLVQVPPNTPLNQAVLAAGGFNTRANRTVRLVRLNFNGTVSEKAVGVEFGQGISEESNPRLQNNDTVVVGRSGLSAVTDTLGTVLNPLSGIFNIFRILRND